MLLRQIFLVSLFRVQDEVCIIFSHGIYKKSLMIIPCEESLMSEDGVTDQRQKRIW